MASSTIIATTDFVELPPQNGFVNFGSPYAPLSVRKLNNTTCEVYGLLTRPTQANANTVIATLPLEFRPQRRLIIEQISFNYQSIHEIARIDLLLSGDLLFVIGGNNYLNCMFTYHI